MKIKSVILKDFKRFTDLKIEGIPESIRLVVLCGPNGSGKSSLFDAFLEFLKRGVNHFYGYSDYSKKTTDSDEPSVRNRIITPDLLEINFYDADSMVMPDDQRKKSLYVRTAYRNDPSFQISQVSRTGPIVDEKRFNRMIENDTSVGLNYQRLVSNALEDLFEREPTNTTIGKYREKVIGDLRCIMQEIFDEPKLVLKGLGSPMEDGTFKFEKGVCKEFLYKNLSGGEKSAFDLILDIIVKKRAYDDTVFCIDEPEAHMSTRLQGRLLRHIFNQIDDNNQLWIATHSIGMMREARDINSTYPDSVVFLDFGNKDFDQPVTIKPTVPDREFWRNTYRVVLDDMASLVAPDMVVLCEGKLGDGFDAECYNEIFKESHPEAQFVSVGGKNDVKCDSVKAGYLLACIVPGTKILRLIDRDKHNHDEITNLNKQDIRVLRRRSIENYLLDDEILRKWCKIAGHEDKYNEVIEIRGECIRSSKERNKPEDDWKSASPEFYTKISIKLKLCESGESYKSFFKEQLAPLIKPGMDVYEELNRIIFGNSSNT